MASRLLHKSNTMYLSKDTTNEHKSLRIQILLSTGTENEKINDAEKIWDKVGFFGYQTTNVTITNANFPGNTLVYANQGSVTPMKGELAIYLGYVILGQLIPELNCPGNIEEYERKPNEVKLITPLYDIDSGEFLGLKKSLAFIMVRGDKDEAFFSYGSETNQKKYTNFYQNYNC